jgi:hypothetical protein
MFNKLAAVELALSLLHELLQLLVIYLSPGSFSRLPSLSKVLQSRNSTGRLAKIVEGDLIGPSFDYYLIV